MRIHQYQKGVGLIEVLIALLLLAVGVLGYSILQIRAVEASSEALSRSQGMLILRALAENMRANPVGQQVIRPQFVHLQILQHRLLRQILHVLIWYVLQHKWRILMLLWQPDRLLILE